MFRLGSSLPGKQEELLIAVTTKMVCDFRLYQMCDCLPAVLHEGPKHRQGSESPAADVARCLLFAKF